MIAPSLHLATAYVLAAFATCTAQNAPVLHFNATEKPPVYTSALTTADLHQMAPTISFANPADFPITSGLTQGNIGLQTSIQFKMQEMAGGGFCLWPTDVDVTLSYSAQVYIAKEYPPDSCRYKETKLHELRHVAADEDVIRQFLPTLNQAAQAETARLTPQGPFGAPDRDVAKSRIFDEVNSVLKGELGKIGDMRRVRQQAIDTPAEYTRLSNVCPGEPLR